MPPKKPVRRTNKKKKGGAGFGGGGGGGGGQPVASSSGTSLQQVNSNNKPAGAIPDFRSKTSAPPQQREGDGSDNNNKSPTGSLYSIYKHATQRFKDGLAALVPVEMFSQDRVQTVMDAVDYIVEQQLTIPSVLLDDCRISLQFRKKYSKRIEGGGDEGHEYFILVLNYCFQSLKPLVPRATRMAFKEKAKQFHFTDFDLSDSEDEEETVPATTARKPERPKEPSHDFTIDDLIKGSDRLQACAFLDSVDTAMEAVSHAYKTLKLNMRYLNIQGPEETAQFMEDIMEAAVTTNFCIRHVQWMEEELQLDHPHLNTFYRVLACVFLVHMTEELNSRARAAGKSVPRTEMTAFIGDVVESGFRNPQSDPQNKVSRLLREFCRKWSLPREEISNLVDATVQLVHLEVQPDNVVQPPQTISHLQQLRLIPHSWMQKKRFIGGDRDILNTQRLVQGLSNLLDKNPPIKLISKPGFFGVSWDEQRHLARKIQGDMDQLLMGEILPELLLTCRVGALSMEIPRLDELLPLFKLLRQYIANPAKPVPFSLTFGVHAILTSIFECQGNNDVTFITVATKVTYNYFFSQLQTQLDSNLPNSTIWRPNLKTMMFCKSLPTAVGPPATDKSDYRAFWNPCCGGMFNTFLSYAINLEGGAVMIDSFAQLRMVLHLYNALQQRNLISGDIPLLTSLDQFFEGVQSVWEGEKPKRENIVKRFWLAYGMRADVVKRMHEECRRSVLSPLSPPMKDVLKTRDGDSTREMTECRPEHFSKSFQRICLGDFSGMVDRYEELHTNLETLPAWQYNFVVRVNDTLDLMASEEELLSWNLMAVGGRLNNFIYALVQKLGWKQFLDASVASLPAGDRRMDGRRLDPRSFIASDAYKERFALVLMFANKLLGPLEFLESVENDPVLIRTRDCFIEYFNSNDMMSYQYFPSFVKGKRAPTEASVAPHITHRS